MRSIENRLQRIEREAAPARQVFFWDDGKGAADRNIEAARLSGRISAADTPVKVGWLGCEARP
jgi:hypothetical protein